MFYLGQDIKSGEALVPISPASLVEQMSADSFGLRPLINRLRSLRFIDKSAYNLQKVKLPYFCFSEFQDNKRLAVHFIETNFLVLDFDDISLSNIESLKQQLKNDPLVFMLFTTPSGEGLKVIFKLNESLKDKKTYNDLGKAFGADFANRYGIIANLDMQTFDVTRASFINPDADTFFNPNANLLSWKEHTRASLLASKYFDQPEIHSEETKPGEPSMEVYKSILEKLKPKSAKTINHLTVDPAIQSICEKTSDMLAEYNLAIISQKPVQYGVQIRIKHADGNMGEVNLYLGKKGYSVVRALKADTHPELNQILESVIWISINTQNQHTNYEYPGLLRRA